MNLKMTLDEVMDLLIEAGIFVRIMKTENTEIEYLSYDSRDIKNNTLFFCKGANYKEEYLNQAITKGAVCYVSEKEYSNTLSDYIIVTDIQRAMAVIAKAFYKNAYEDIETIGITGTKESHLTTPEALQLEKLFYETKISNIKYLTMEVTSQAYKKDRVYGVKFKNGMFLNISEAHISDAEHQDFEDYFNCKLELIDNSNRMIINRDTDYFNIIIDRCKNKEVITYGKDNKADYYYTNVEKTSSGFRFNVINEKKEYNSEFEITMQGRFNIENAVAAITMAKVLGVDDEAIKKGLIKTEVMGRMNVYEKDGITVIVDYAHNELSFTKLYESIKLDYPGRRIVSVGGGPGGKAYRRRKDFGVIVGQNSDYIYLTAEDPQFE